MKNNTIMERGYIKIKENSESQLIVEAKLVNCTLWMTKHEIADLFNVFVSSVGNNLRSIFLVSCGSNSSKSNYEKTINDHLLKGSDTKENLNFKIVELNEQGNVTVADSIAYLTEEFKKSHFPTDNFYGTHPMFEDRRRLNVR